jgi:hypothetical protein
MRMTLDRWQLGRVTADIYSHAIHSQDDDAARRWEECRERNRLSQTANSMQ